MNTRPLMVLAAVAALVPAGIGSADAYYSGDYDSVQDLQDCVESKGHESADYMMRLIQCTNELHKHDTQIEFY